MSAAAKAQPPIADIIVRAWEDRATISANTQGDIREAVEAALADVDAGRLRVAEKTSEGWVVNQWVKQAILLSFRLNPMRMMPGSAGESSFFYDKVPVKWEGWREEEFKAAGFRAVPGAVARYGSYIAKDVVLMPSFVNIGAYVDEGTMVDAWATVGSCAQIGKNCHISGGAGIGGVLEPLQAGPVIIEDDCFIGARSEVAEGVVIEQGSVLAMGVYISASTKIVNRETGEVTTGRIPPYSVVVPGNMPAKKEGDPSLYCAVIVKQVDAQTRSKTGINDLLRGF